MARRRTPTPPSECQIARTLELFKQVKDPFQRGKVLGKLEAYVEMEGQPPSAAGQKAG